MMTDRAIKSRVDWYKEIRNAEVTSIEILAGFDDEKPAHWFVPEQRAKVWTTVKAIKHFTSYAKCKDKINTFNEYEIVINGSEIIPLDKFLEDNSK